VVEGADETLTDDAANLVRQLAAGMPAAWNAATRGRSTMSTAVIPPAGASCDSGGNRLCVIPISAVARHPIELAARP
jgi:hypothetical protein